jgi:thymidine kinase
MNLLFVPGIDIVFGPMFSGKTTETLRRLSIYHEMDLKVLYINSILDVRNKESFSTHNQTIQKIPFDSLKTQDLKEVNVDKYDVVAVDEAQFFPNLKEIVLDWVECKNKIVVISGLNGDFKRHRSFKIGRIRIFPRA